MTQKKPMLTLKNDVIFKEFFSKKGNEVYLKEFLSALLNIEIKKIEIQKDFALSRTRVYEKYGILDLKAILNNEKIVDIEMQMAEKENFVLRSEYYASKITASELNGGNCYDLAKPVIIIAILNYKMFDFEEYISESVTVLKEHPEYILDTMHKYYFIELQKFREKNDLKDLDNIVNQWLTFIDGTDKKGVDFVMEKNNTIKRAEEDLEYLTGDEELLRFAELRQKAIMDEQAVKAYAMRVGKEEGIKEGEKKGIILIAKNMLNLKLDLGLISKSTGLTIEEIQNIK